MKIFVICHDMAQGATWANLQQLNPQTYMLISTNIVDSCKRLSGHKINPDEDHVEWIGNAKEGKYADNVERELQFATMKGTIPPSDESIIATVITAHRIMEETA